MTKERLFNPESFFEKYKIGFDHDGVIADTRQPVVDEYNKIFGTNHTIDEMREYHTLAKWAKEDLGVSEEAALEIDSHLWFERPDILLRAEPMPGAVEFTRWLVDKKISFSIVTSRLPSYRQSTFEWYERKMPWISNDKIFIRENDEMAGEIFKVWMIKILGVNLFFEDLPHHAKEIISYTDAVVVLLNNNPILDHIAGDQIIRITSSGDRLPTLHLPTNIDSHSYWPKK